MKVDLDELARKAQAVRVESSDAEWFIAMAEYRGAFVPSVTLALIARIHELEELVAQIIHDHVRDVDETEMRAILGKGVTIP